MRARLGGRDAPGLEGQLRIARRRDRHRARQPRRAVQDVAGPALEVGRRQQRDGRRLLQPVEERRRRERVALAAALPPDG